MKRVSEEWLIHGGEFKDQQATLLANVDGKKVELVAVNVEDGDIKDVMPKLKLSTIDDMKAYLRSLHNVHDAIDWGPDDVA